MLSFYLLYFLTSGSFKALARQKIKKLPSNIY